MPKFIRKCRVCGAEYEACKTPNPNHVFRWQDVACSPEHGQEYLQRILASRSGSTDVETKVETETVAPKSKKRSKKAPVVVEVPQDDVMPEAQLESEDEQN